MTLRSRFDTKQAVASESG